ncbi:hypothetical protein BV898_09002 [Hypsibius exemplaris]|uniref:Calcineurin-like phosphoesterase domain-containing protein n=1 Tax=Hypsibius exemplaris TaxID=2072580 RepID=A0A1W0WNN3_HYPEX|nr:hypothetical protein BV898_09002 [Hypsibius exemplaris]
MNLATVWRSTPRWCKLAGCFYSAILLYHEYLCYLLLPWTWPRTGILETLYPHFRVHAEDRTVLRILFVADPQIQGLRNEPSGVLGKITRWDADRYLGRTFERAAKYVDPHLVIYLGDLLDEGTTTNDYVNYAKRFHDIFLLPNAKVIYVPGDNDIGGEGGELVTDENIGRFRSSFRSDASSFWDDSVQFIEISGLAGQVVLSNSSRRKRPLIVLGHIPFLWGYPDPDAMKMLDELKPALIFSAHNHEASLMSRAISEDASRRVRSLPSDFSIFNLSPSPGDIQEVVVPTCSYRMGVPRMGFGFAVLDLTANRLFYTVLWLPSRYPHLFTELCATVAFVLALVCGFGWRAFRFRHLKKVSFQV